MTSERQNPSNLTRLFDEVRWVIQIRHSLEEELDDDTGIPVSIFNVPKAIQASKPEAYTPQLIALGPYHHWSPELYEMERYKLAAAKRIQKHLRGGLKLQDLVNHFLKLEHKIRAYYHRYLDFSGETLAWMTVVDASFLLEFLQIYAVVEGKTLRRITSRFSHLVDQAGRKSAHNVILRDVTMLENQIPMFLLRKILDFQFSSTQEADNFLSAMLIGFMKELCPFKMLENFPIFDPTQHSHLLELLYWILVPKSEDPIDNNDIEEQNEEANLLKEKSLGDSSHVKQLLTTIWNFGSNSNAAALRGIKQVASSKPIKLAVSLPWKVLSSLPGLKLLKQPLESLFTSGNENSDTENPSSSHNINKPPLIEEIMIPSVTELIDAGVRFSPTKGDLTTIVFDAQCFTFYLPTVCLDANTEVILKNLVAFEASGATGPLVFARYTELMNGIIDTEEDVMLLRKSGVIVNRLKSDEAVARVWNGLTKSVRLTRVPFLDKVIEDVNRYHSSRWRVKTRKFMKKYVFGSWQFLTFLAAVLMILLTTLQAFCSVYSCARWFGTTVAVKG